MNFYKSYIDSIRNPVSFTETQKVAIDYAKAIGIILVLIGHYPNNIMNYFQPYVFHMPLFFFIGGVLFNPVKRFKLILKDVIFKYYIYIIAIYLFLAACNLLLNHFFGTPTRQLFGTGLFDTINIIANNNFHNNGFFLVGWFLFAFSFVYILSALIIKTTIHLAPPLIPALVILSVAFSYIGIKFLSIEYQSTKFFIYNIACQVLVGSSFYILGFLLRKIIFKSGNLLFLSILFCTFVTLSDSWFISPLGMAWSLYPKGYLIAMIGAIIGITITFSLSSLFSHAVKSELFSIVGRKSKDVICFHLLVFSLIDCFSSCIGVFTIDKNELFTRFTTTYSFSIYMILGVVISILIGKSISKFSRGLI